MASRTWLAVALCCLVWFTYMRWFAPPPPSPNSAGAPTTAAATPAAAPDAAPDTVSGATPFDTPLQVQNSFEAQTSKMQVGFSDSGGKISRIDLKDFTETLKSDSPPIELVGPISAPYSLATFFSDPTLQSFASSSYERTSPSPTQVRYRREASGVEVVKDYRFLDSDYLTEAEFKFRFKSGDRKDWGYLMIPVGATELKYDASHPLNSWEVVAYQNESIKRRSTEKIESAQEVLQGSTAWLGFGNRYFSTVLINGAEINPDIVLAKDRGFVGAYLRYPLVLKADQKEVTYKIRLYSGPKDYAELGKIPGLKQLIDYGTFSFFAYPLLELLRFFYKFVHNYGLAIILLTVLVRLLFYPLSLKSYRSMKSMQKLQPQITALKEKYKDDAQRFGQEQMALFKAHKVNPAGGCLPMLVQLPVFIALYAVLGNSIELFHAPFFGWIQDLSSKDPYYIFPILMGISMFLQQRMTPTPGMDPAQQKVMLLMPIVFTFVMLNLPSGLTIYIFLSTLMGIVQQVLMNREGHGPAALAAPSPRGSK